MVHFERCLTPTFVEHLFLLRQSVTALARNDRSLGIATLVGGLIVPPEENQQQ